MNVHNVASGEVSAENMIGTRNDEGIATAVSILKQQMGERLSTSQSVREHHAHTTTQIPIQVPDAVVFPHTTEEVADIVKICAEHKVPIIPFGIGSSLEGHVNAPLGGVSIAFSQMDKIIEVNSEDLDCVIQPGVTREQLNEYLRDTGLFFPIDPGANASIGGMAATRASGTNAVRYGTMKDNIINITAVMPSGEIVKTAQRAKKTSAGYDLTRLLIGSEGTLGVITELTVKLYGIPEKIGAATCSFPSVEAACNTVIATMQIGIPMARIELLDTLQVQAVNAYSKLDLPESPLLLLEFHGSETGVEEQSELFRDIAEDNGASEFQWTMNHEERNKLWKARHDAYWSVLNLDPGKKAVATDACVPISRLAECVGETQQDIETYNLTAPIVGHVGDGNFHVTVLMDPEDTDEAERVEHFKHRLYERAIAMDGTCSGEHGIGQGKQQYLPQELGGSVDVMRAVKQAIDPNNIMNPGKIFV